MDRDIDYHYEKFSDHERCCICEELIPLKDFEFKDLLVCNHTCYEEWEGQQYEMLHDVWSTALKHALTDDIGLLKILYEKAKELHPMYIVEFDIDVEYHKLTDKI